MAFLWYGRKAASFELFLALGPDRVVKKTNAAVARLAKNVKSARPSRRIRTLVGDDRLRTAYQ
jgi:hypothetical protein